MHFRHSDLNLQVRLRRVTVNEDIDYNGNKYPIASLPDNLVKIIDAGGLVKAMRKLNGLD